jgi:hypothetical protein
MAYTLGLKKSCFLYNLNLETIFHEGSWNSHRLKDQYIEKFLSKIHPQEIIFFTDGYDTVFVTNEKEILGKYYALDSPVVFSTEVNCYPYSTFAYLYQGNRKFKYLNSGGYIGKAGDILQLYKSLKNLDLRQRISADGQYHWSNQYHWTKLYLYFDTCIKLDTDCSIFQTFANDLNFKPNSAVNDEERKRLIEEEISRILSDFELGNYRVFNKVTKSEPCHLHFNSIYLKNFMFSSSMESVLPWMKERLTNEMQ